MEIIKKLFVFVLFVGGVAFANCLPKEFGFSIGDGPKKIMAKYKLRKFPGIYKKDSFIDRFFLMTKNGGMYG